MLKVSENLTLIHSASSRQLKYEMLKPTLIESGVRVFEQVWSWPSNAEILETDMISKRCIQNQIFDIEDVQIELNHGQKWILRVLICEPCEFREDRFTFTHNTCAVLSFAICDNPSV